MNACFALKWEVLFTAEFFLDALISGLVSMFFLGYMKMYIDKKLAAAEKEKEKHEEYQRRRNIAHEELQHALGRLLFWLRHGLMKPPPNGELQEAWEAYTEAEAKCKAIDQEIIAEFTTK